MCGIFLVLERGLPLDATLARHASRSLHHRGPDGNGDFVFEQVFQTPGGPVAVNGFLGHTRLSIQDPISRSDQPFRRGPLALIYNGEVYNFKALRQELTRSGERFDTEGDTEVLLRLLARDGVAGLNRANGMWAFCLLDQDKGRLTAVRDRYGKKPLFYYLDADTVCMASEIAPILRYLGRSPCMVQSDLDQFLRDGWAFPYADGATHLQGIRQVRAGAALEFDLQHWKARERPWFDLAGHVATGERSPTQLAAIVADAVGARLVADRRVGLLLSGGVDSSLILSVLADQQLLDQVTCFTGDAGKSDDALYARQCGEALGIRSVNLALDYSNTGMDHFLQVCRHQEKPFPFIGNALAMPQLYAHIASHDVPVVLDGTGGDEVFAGYRDRYFRFAMAQALAQDDRQWIDSVMTANSDDPKMAAIMAQAMVSGVAGFEPAPRAHGIARGPDDPHDLDELVQPGVREAPGCDPLASFHGDLTQALVLDAGRGRLAEWLWQNDRNAMMSGIENRSPLLDYRLAPYMASGYRDKFAGHWNKHSLRSVFPVPLPTQWRRDKQGFRWVYHRFLRNNRDQVLQLIAASKILPERVDVGRLLERARHDDAYLGCNLLHRMLCVAGLEQTTGMGGLALQSGAVDPFGASAGSPIGAGVLD